MRHWIAGATIALAMAAPLSLEAQTCDSRALLGSCAAAAPSSASFLDLMTDAASGRDDESVPALTQAFPDFPAGQAAAETQPAVYLGAPARAMGAALDTPLSGAANPAPESAWVLALAFLGLMVLRRTRAARNY